MVLRSGCRGPWCSVGRCCRSRRAGPLSLKPRQGGKGVGAIKYIFPGDASQGP